MAGCPLWAKGLLVASLAANLGVAGLAIGHSMKERGPDLGVGREIAWIVRLVPEDRRDMTKRHMRVIRDELRESGFERQQHLEGIVSAIRTGAFDASALDAILVERRNAAARRQALVHDRLTTLMVQFSTEERTVFADNLQVQLDRMRARNGEP